MIDTESHRKPTAQRWAFSLNSIATIAILRSCRGGTPGITSPFTSTVPGSAAIHSAGAPVITDEHVDGDYKHPRPKEKYDHLYELSKSLMKRDPVKIEYVLRQFIADAVAEKLLEDGIQVLIVSLTAKHLHVLARFPRHNARMQIGYAKKYATQKLKAHGLAVGFNLEIGEGIWAKRSRAEPIKSRTHQVSTFGYIREHVQEGARIWRYDQPA